MLNRRTVLLGIFCILFVVPTALAQSQLEILNAIHSVKTELSTSIASVDKNLAVLSTNLEGVERRLDQKIDQKIESVEGRLEAKIDEVKSLVTLLMWIMSGVGALFLAIFLKLIWPSLTRRKSEVENPSAFDLLQQALQEDPENRHAPLLTLHQLRILQREGPDEKL